MCAIVVVGNGELCHREWTKRIWDCMTWIARVVGGKGKWVAIACDHNRKAFKTFFHKDARSSIKCQSRTSLRRILFSSHSRTHIYTQAEQRSEHVFIFIFNFSMLNGALGSAPFAKVNNLLYDFFSSSLAAFDNKKKMLFFALGNSNDLPTYFSLFFLLIHMQRAKRCVLCDWLMWGVENEPVLVVCDGAVSSEQTILRPPDTAHAPVSSFNGANKRTDNPPPKIGSENEHRNVFRIKIHDLSQRKSTRRAQCEWNEKRNFCLLLGLFSFPHFAAQKKELGETRFNFTCSVH